jgi:RNA 2',3'-cyclic 3'-phosphodiesterase
MPQTRPSLVPRHNLFVAVFPGAEASAKMARAGSEMKDMLGIRGKPRPTNHFHCTLYHVGSYVDELPASDVQAAIASCETAANLVGPFEVRFDRMRTFEGRRGNHPFVLSSKDGNSTLDLLHQLLVTEFMKRGFSKSRHSKFTPHVTFSYAKQPVDEMPIEPIDWPVKELLLIHSLIGKTEYRVLGRWQLQG